MQFNLLVETPHKNNVDQHIHKFKVSSDYSEDTDQFSISGVCVAASEFGETPSFEIVGGDQPVQFSFNQQNTGRLHRQHQHHSANSAHARFGPIELGSITSKVTVELVSECGTKRLPLANLSCTPVHRLYQIADHQIETDTLDLTDLGERFEQLPEADRASGEGELMQASLGLIQHSYNGPYEAEFMRLRQKHKWTPLLRRYGNLINRAMHPWKVDGHGVSIQFANFDASPSFWADVQDFIETLSDAIGPTFAVSGTLLGLVRENRLLPHDDDIDVAVILPADTMQAAAKQWVQTHKTLEKLGLMSDRHETGSVSQIIKAKRIQGIPIDIFPAWIEDDHLFVYPHTFGELKTADMFPMAHHENAGVSIPAQPEKMLAVNYGDNWRVPDKNSKLPWIKWNKQYEAFLQEIEKQKEI